MGKYKIMVLDLDGTLLNEESCLENENKEALQKLMRDGGKVVLCSSRAFEEMRNIIEELYEGFDDQFCIGFGGACVFSRDGRMIETGKTIERENAVLLIEEAERSKIPIHGYDGNMLFYYRETEALQRFLQFADVAHIPMQRIPYETFLKKDFLKLMCLGKRTKLERYHETVGNIAYAVFSNPAGAQGYLDLCQRDVSKKTGVEILCRYLGVDRTECICVGDGENDIPMLQFAGLGIAMKNASDCVKEAADYVAPYTNCEKGVHYLVNKFMK